MSEISEQAFAKADSLAASEKGGDRRPRDCDYRHALARQVQQVSDAARRLKNSHERESCQVWLSPANLSDLADLILPDPVDPLLIEAREIVAKWHEGKPNFHASGHTPEAYRAGKKDEEPEVKQALVALKRGLKIVSADA